MKKLALALLAVATLTACQDVKHSVSSRKSSVVGLNRVIKLYAADGSIIREWRTKSKVESGDGGGAVFFDGSNNKIYIQGTFVVEEFD
jgi:hypothetical protein